MGLRKVIRHLLLNGCHLKGPFGDVLLSVVRLDANYGLFLIVICVCEFKNT